MGMTSDTGIIFRETGLKVGKVYFGEKEYAVSERENRIYDTETGNFHLFPEFVIGNDNVNDWKNYFEILGEVRTEIVRRIKKKTHVEVINRAQYVKPDKIERYNPETLYLYDRGGKSGALGGIPHDYVEKGLNRFFTYIPMYKGGRYYAINYMRLYIDRSNSVNCRYGKIQFDTSISRFVNKDGIHYPTSFIGQNEKKIRLSDSFNQACIFNPVETSDIWTIKNDEHQIEVVVEAFLKFVHKVEEM